MKSLKFSAAAAAVALAASAAHAETEITWWHAMGGALGETVNQIAADFNASQDEYTITPVFKGTYEETLTAGIAAFRAGEQPNILQVFDAGAATVIGAKGATVPVQDLLTDNGVAFDITDYISGVRYFYADADDKMIGMPFNSSSPIMYYNVEALEKAGVTPPKTWEEFLTVCETLKENGYAPLTIGTKYRWTAAAWFDYLNMRVNGPEFHINLMLGKESYEDPRVLKVFTDYWQPLIENGYFIEEPAAYSWQEALQFMIDGEAAMYLMGDFIRDSYPDDVEAEQLDFFQFPIIDPNVPIGEDAPTDGYFISANSQNPEAAKKFLAFLGSAEVQEYFAEKVGRLATNNEVDMSLYSENQQKGIEMIQTADYVAQFYDRDTTPEMADEGMNGFMRFWDNPDEIEEILANLEMARQEIFAEAE